MLRILYKMMTLFVLLSNHSTFADTPQFDINSLYSINWHVEDYPDGLIEFVSDEYPKIDPARDAPRFVRVVLLTSFVALDKFPDIGEKLNQAESLAEDLKLFEEMIQIKYQQLSIKILEMRKSKTYTSEAAEAIYQRYLNDAKKTKVKRLYAIALGQYSYHLRMKADDNGSLKVLLEANEILKQDPETTDLQTNIMRVYMAQTLVRLKQMEKAKEQYDIILDFCDKNTLRRSCQVNLYNYGVFLLQSENQEEIEKSGPVLEKALKLAEESNRVFAKGVAHNALTLHYDKMKQLDKARFHNKESRTIFKEASATIWLADSYYKLAAALVNAKQFREALKEIETSRKLFPKDFTQDHNNLDRASYRAYEGVGNFKKALEYHVKYTESFKKMTEEKEKNDFSKMKVNMGLQIEEERNKLLNAESERLKIIAVIILGLLLVAIVSMVMAIKKGKEVRRSKTKMQRILDNIDEGLMTITPNMTIESEYSRHLTELIRFSGTPTGLDGIQETFRHAGLSDDEKDVIRESFKACLGEDELQWIANSHHIPNEFILHDQDEPRYISAHWQPLFDSHQLAEGFLVGLRDITDRKKLEIQVAEERRKNSAIEVKISELAKTKLSKVKSVLKKAREITPPTSAKADVKDAMRKLHTMKGVARTLGLQSLSSIVHELETDLQSNSAPSEDLWDQYLRSLNEYHHIISDLFGQGENQKSQKTTLADIVSDTLSQLADRSKSSGVPIASVAIEDRVIYWPENSSEVLENLVVHSLNNSIDHGFLIPKDSGFEIANPQLSITANIVGENIEVRVKDNGQGLNWQVVESKAQEIGITNYDDIAEILFHDGFSSSEKVTETSGRGVGLSAIRHACHKLGGEIFILATKGKPGTEILARIPFQDEQYQTSA